MLSENISGHPVQIHTSTYWRANFPTAYLDLLCRVELQAPKDQ
jgi:hypothetical protein